MKTAKHRAIRMALAAFLVSVASLPAGTALAQEGCKPDLAKFCPQARPGGGQIAACLKANAAQLSSSCKARVDEMKSALKEVDQACEEDIHAFCAGTQPGGGRLAACLKQNAASLSPTCKTKIEQAKAMR